MRRRDLLASGVAAAAFASLAAAQQIDRPRRLGVLMEFAENDPRGQALLAVFIRRLAELGWQEGRNLKVDTRFAGGQPERMRALAAELTSLQPDLILASGTPVTIVLKQTTQSIPLVFVQVADPVGNGIVQSLSRPGRHITGFANFEPTMVGKWLELLKEAAPGVKRALLLQNPENPTWHGYLRIAATAAPALAVEPVPRGVHDAAEIEAAVAEFAREPNGGVVVLPDATTTVMNRDRLISLARQYRLPAVYPFRYVANLGGLIGYGPDPLDIFHRGAGYVDRILRGASPGDLPVEAPTKFELAINLKTARDLGLTIPPVLLARADELIE